MLPEALRAARNQRNWTGTEAARRIDISQSYLAMLEGGQRKVTPRLARKFKAVYGLRPTVLSMPEVFEPHGRATSADFAKEVAALGYPGFAYLKGGLQEKNPAEVLAGALAQEILESRVVEALPWLLLQYWDMDLKWLVAQAKLNDLQNRLGFVASLAKRVSEWRSSANNIQTESLTNLGKMLEASRLVREDTFFKRVHTNVEREWLRLNRSEDASHWNLLTNWRPEHLPYAS